MAWLHRNKRYPQSARMRGARGVGMIRIKLAKSGHVISTALVKGTGHEDLDNELKRLLKRASPGPAAPSAMNDPTNLLTLPVRFGK